MKRYSSPTLKFIAVFYMAFPLVYLLGAAILFDVPIGRIAAVSISPLFFLASAMGMISGYGLWEVKRWAWHLFAVTNAVVAYLSIWVVVNHGSTHHGLLAVLFALSLLAVVMYRVTRELRVPYFSPRIKWWESNPKYKLDLPAEVRRSHSEPLSGSIMDLSPKGCFVRIKEDVPEDARVTVGFWVFGYRLECAGVVVWSAPSSVTHPKGIGVKFDRMPRPAWKRLRLVSRRLRRLTAIYGGALGGLEPREEALAESSSGSNEDVNN